MKIQRILVFLVVIIILIDLAYFYPKLTGKVSYEIEVANVTKIIDGDTLKTNIGTIRLLGINTPEKNMPFYEEAKNYLNKTLGKEVEIEIHEKDKYERILGYAFYNKKFINEEILEEGLGNLYVYEKDKYTETLKKAEKNAREKGLGIWKKSENYGCIEIIELRYVEQESCKNQEKLVLNNKCDNMNLTLKDNANHIFKINLEKGVFEKNFSCTFNDEGDSLFVWDNDGMVLYYGY